MIAYQFRKGNFYGNIVPNTRELDGGEFTHKVKWVYQIGREIFTCPRQPGKQGNPGIRILYPDHFVSEDELSKETCPWEFGEFEMPEAEKIHY